MSEIQRVVNSLKNYNRVRLIILINDVPQELSGKVTVHYFDPRIDLDHFHIRRIDGSINEEILSIEKVI